MTRIVKQGPRTRKRLADEIEHRRVAASVLAIEAAGFARSLAHAQAWGVVVPPALVHGLALLDAELPSQIAELSAKERALRNPAEA